MWRRPVRGLHRVAGRQARAVVHHAAVVGKQIVTIEGLEQNGTLRPVQEAFLKEEAFQCAYCTSGMILSAVALLSSNKNPSDAEIIHAMNGNICRCGTYPRIVAAVRDAAQAGKKA
jgi:aerobic-type carbon monoxide dehydrogenase small subunit (CoxS/CutS family)